VALGRELIKKLLTEYGADEQVQGIIQVGSSAKGYGDEHSDVDLEMVVAEKKYSALVQNYQKIIHTEKYDLVFTTISELQQIKDSDRDEDHWSYQNAIIILDRTGNLQEMLHEIIQYDEASRLRRLKRYYRGYWENTISTYSCLEHKNYFGARVYVAFLVQELICLLFNFNHLWSPNVKWAFKEIHQLKRKPEKIETQMESILQQPATDKLSILWDQVANLLREEKYTWIDHPEELL
jgi:hypothetical protein